MITKQTLQAIVDYLTTKPYCEVYKLMAKIFEEVNKSESLEKIPEQKNG